MKLKLRKGFTLVELLIVIVIIGILAGAMLLASGAATASAEASNIVSNLRSLQSASLMFFADNMDALMAATYTAADFPRSQDPVNSARGASGGLWHLLRYTNNPEAGVWTSYAFHIVGSGPLADRAWWVSAQVTRTDVANRLRGRADSVGLYGQAHEASAISGAAFYPGNAAVPHDVFMLVRNPGDGN